MVIYPTRILIEQCLLLASKFGPWLREYYLREAARMMVEAAKHGN